MSTSPRLSDSKIYPTFLRVVAPDNSIGIGIVALMGQLNWKYISIITQEEDIFTLVSFITELRCANQEVVSKSVFLHNIIQTREVLIDQLDKSSIAESVGFPTDESPQNALLSVQV